jgi:hypothetical protein
MENIPHQSVVYIKAEIMDRLPDGRVSGQAVEKLSQLFTFKANSQEEVTQLTKEFLEKVTELWTKMQPKV